MSDTENTETGSAGNAAINAAALAALSAECDAAGGRLNGLVMALAERGLELPAESEVTAFALTTIDELQARDTASAAAWDRLIAGLSERGFVLVEGSELNGHIFASIDGLQAENVALAKKLATAQAKAKAVPSVKKGRKLGPLKEPVGPRSDDDGVVSAEKVLLELINAAETVEVAFSDGKTELPQLPALVVSGEDAWAITAAGLKLTLESLPVHGSDRPFDIRGYGLVLDDKLVAYRVTEPRRIMPGTHHSLVGDVVF